MVFLLAVERNLGLDRTVGCELQQPRVRPRLAEHIRSLGCLLDAVDLVLRAVVPPHDLVRFSIAPPLDLDGRAAGRVAPLREREQDVSVWQHPALAGVGRVAPLDAAGWMLGRDLDERRALAAGEDPPRDRLGGEGWARQARGEREQRENQRGRTGQASEARRAGHGRVLRRAMNSGNSIGRRDDGRLPQRAHALPKCPQGTVPFPRAVRLRRRPSGSSRRG